MRPIERLIQSREARANQVARGAQVLIDTLAAAAFAKLWEAIQANPGADVRELAASAQVDFSDQFSEALAASFSSLLQRSVQTSAVRDMPVGEIPLSAWLYSHSQEVATEVARIVRQHAQGVQQARELSLALYDGYSPQDGVRRPLEGSARGELPQALRSMTADPAARASLQQLMTQGQQQAGRLRTRALRAAYLEAFEAWERGAGQEALQKRLDVAQREKNRFLADRIAQTELHRAHQAVISRDLMQDADTTVVQVKLNPTHPRVDICDLHTRADLWGLGPGLYPKAEAPRPPFHPFCRCVLRPRPSLSAAGAQFKPGAAAGFLRRLGPDGARMVMGSNARAAEVLDGAAPMAVVDRGKPASYRTLSVGEAAAQAHALLNQPPSP